MGKEKTAIKQQDKEYASVSGRAHVGRGGVFYGRNIHVLVRLRNDQVTNGTVSAIRITVVLGHLPPRSGCKIA